MEGNNSTLPPQTPEAQPVQNLSQAPLTTPKPDKPKRNTPFLKILIFVFVGLFTVLAVGLIYYIIQNQNEVVVTDYESCVAAGNPVLESYPEQCTTPDGQSFARVLTPEERTKINAINPEIEIDISDWKTFKGNGYSFDYPTSHDLQKMFDGMLVMGPRAENERSNPIFRIRVYEDDNTQNTNFKFMDGLSTYFTTNIGEKFCPPKEPFGECYVRKSDININNYIARIFENRRDEEPRGLTAVIKIENKLYVITPAFNPYLKNEYTEIDNKILKSLKLTE